VSFNWKEEWNRKWEEHKKIGGSKRMLRMHMACSSLYNTTNDTHNGGIKNKKTMSS